MIFQDLWRKNSLWYLDTDATTTNTKTGYDARRLLTRQNAVSAAPQDVNIIIPLNRYTTSGFFHISASIDNVQHTFVYLKNSYRDANDHRQKENSPYILNTFSLLGE